jgi:hypothetical protein
MGTARYLVAKYVSDVFRNEPVNIGVLTWIDGKVGWKFLGQKEDNSINGRAAGLYGKIKSLPNYKQWVESWVFHLQEPILRDKQRVIPNESPEFLDILATHSGQSYILETGGQLMEDVPPDEVALVTDHLFRTLVWTPDEKEPSKSADEWRDELLRDANVAVDPNVKRDEPVELKLRGKPFRPRFNIYIGNGTPQVLAQMVPLTANGRTAQNSARAVEFLFERVLEQRLLPQEKCVSFVYTKDENDDLIQESLDELALVSTVIDITKDRGVAVRKITEWVEQSKRH